MHWYLRMIQKHLLKIGSTTYTYSDSPLENYQRQIRSSEVHTVQLTLNRSADGIQAGDVGKNRVYVMQVC